MFDTAGFNTAGPNASGSDTVVRGGTVVILKESKPMLPFKTDGFKPSVRSSEGLGKKLMPEDFSFFRA